MSFEQLILYNNPLDFTFDDDEIEVLTTAKLKLVPVPGQHFVQGFASDAGFTFDANKLEFVAGLLKQIDQAPADFTSLGTYTNNINLNYGGGVLTGTPFGGAAVLANKLDLTFGDVRYVDYAGLGNASPLIQTGAVKFKLTPNYTGTPSANRIFYIIIKDDGGSNNKIQLLHLPGTGQLNIAIHDSSGAAIIAANFGVWSPTAGVKYEIELNFDVTAGATRLFITGAQLGPTNNSTGTRSNSADLLRIGNGVGSTNSDFAIEDLILFDTVQHTANYTPGYTLTETRFLEAPAALPAFVYAGIGNLESFDDFATIETASPSYVLNGLYWDGFNWVASDSSYPQASSEADVIANLATLPVTSTVNITVVFQATNTESSINNLDLEYSGQIYPVTDPDIVNNSAIFADSLDLFAATFAVVGDDTVTFQMIANESPKWWNGSTWVTATLGNIVESNTIAEINAGKAALALTNGANLKVNAIIHSDDGTTTPELTSVILCYGFQGEVPVTPTECFLFAYLKDILADAKGGELVIENKKTFSTAGTLVSANIQKVTFDENGYVEISVVETETVGKKYAFSINYTDIDGNAKVSKLGNAEVPNKTNENIANLVF